MIPKILVFLFLVSIVYSSETTPENSLQTNQTLQSVDLKIKTFVWKPFDQTAIRAMAENLVYEEKVLLYSKHKKKKAEPALLNFLLPGLGSWIQGDPGGGMLLELLSLTTISLAFATLLEMFTLDLGPSPRNLYEYNKSVSSYYGQKNITLLLGGLTIVSLVSHIALSICLPIDFSRKWNLSLESSLGIDKNELP